MYFPTQTICGFVMQRTQHRQHMKQHHQQKNKPSTFPKLVDDVKLGGAVRNKLMRILWSPTRVSGIPHLAQINSMQDEMLKDGSPGRGSPEKDLYILLDKLNMSHHSAIAAEAANCILGCISNRE